ncbi:MAG TPA: Gx transporter family protein [Spirochaetota bacterium]|nr:Gx transporter family protein [Spirochaetota bacterium]
MKNKQETLALFSGLSAFIAVFENLIPTPLPILRLGLSNIPICLGFSIFSFREVFFILIFKTVFSHLFRGTLFGYPFLIGLTGGLFFIFFSYPFYKIFKKHISFVGLNIVGAFLHNVGQILCSLIFIPPDAAIFFAIFLLVIGTITGFITGLISNRLYNRIFTRYIYEK